MNRSKKPLLERRSKKNSPRLDFEGSHEEYRKLLATMDRVEDIDGKRFLFRELFFLLTRMELGIRSRGGQA
jgi:hypothetical protein